MKRALACFLAATLLLCAGCTQTAPLPTPTPTQSVEPTPTPSVAAKGLPRWEDDHYRGLEKCFSFYEDDLTKAVVGYPRVEGEQEDSPVNTLLRQEGEYSWFHNGKADEHILNEGFAEGDWYPDRNDNKLLSVRFHREFNTKGAAHPGTEEWGVTLNRESGKRLSLDDLVDTGDDFELWLRAQNWVELNYWMPGGGTPEDIEYQLGLYLERSPDPAEHIRDFYVTDSALVIIAWEYPQADTRLSVPLSDLKLKGDDLWNG